MNWLYSLVYDTVEGITGLPPDNVCDALLVDGSLLTAIQNMWTSPQDFLAFVLYWLFIGLMVVGLFALFRWMFVFVFRLFRLD